MTAQTEHSVPWRPANTLAARLRMVRAELKLSQREAALRTGLTYGEWQSMENGADARGIDRKVKAICDSLNVDREWLLWGTPTIGWCPGDIQPISMDMTEMRVA